jgi:ABC-type branched-subunit amino acid transport system substrate-binding protein
MGEKDFGQMKTGELAEMARRAGIKDVDKMNKEEIQRALSNKKSPQSKKSGKSS